MATFTVSTLADELYGGGDLAAETADGGGLSLREALALTNANPGADTITFDPALTGGTTAGVDDGVITLGGTELVITNDVTINGDVDGDNVADITVSGSGASRVFNIDDGLASAITANLNGLVVRDGYQALDGGAIRVADDTLIVTNSTITANVAQRQGGGIINFGTTTLINTTVSGNQSALDGGAIVNLGILNITNSTLSDNQAVGGSGGAVANYGSNAELNLTNTTVSGNFADGGGGGIVNQHGSAALINTTVVGNEADRGGGIYNGASTLPSTLALTNSTVSGNLAGYTGGGIQSSNFNAATTLTNTIVAGNQAVLYGTIFDGHDVQTAGTLTLTGGNIVGDTRTIDGANPQSGIALTDIFASVTNNPDTGVLSGTLASNGGPVQTIALNEAASNPALDAGDDGLAPATDARDFSRDDVAGAANNGTNVSDLGAFEASHSLVVTTLADTVDPTDGLLSLREALALANLDPTTHDTITFDLSLIGGTDPGVDDGHLFVDNGELTIAGDVTINGELDGDGTADIVLDADFASRVLHVTGGVSTLNALVIAQGTVSGVDHGGGILVDQTAALTVNNSIVLLNHADESGGGIANDGLLVLNNVLLGGGNTALAGGGIYNGGTGTALLTNTTIYGNYASDVGGGMANAGAATLTNVTVTGNQAYGVTGGGIANTGDLTLTNSIIAGNDAPTDSDLADTGTLITNGANLFSQAGVGDAGDIAGADIADIFRDIGTNPFTGADGGLVGDNGGPLPTIAIKAGGLAHDAAGTIVPADTTDADGNGDLGEPLPVDARGFARDVDGADIGAVELQHGATYTVTTLDDEEFDGGDLAVETADGGGLSLREALALTNADPLSADTIQFDNGLVGGTLTLVHGELDVSGDTVIDGDVAGGTDMDITIDAAGASRVFGILSGTSTLNGLVMTGGDASCGCGPAAAYYGGAVSIGAIYFGGYANVTISNSLVRNSYAYYGGGISVDTGSSLRLVNSTVTENDADIGGGIAVNAGATLTTINTTISDNHAAGLYGYGGGVAIYDGASATLINTTISGNTAYSGGGIYNSSDLTLINTTLANNSAAYGGGLYNTPCGCATADVFNSTITGNFADIGGGIAHYAGTLNLTNSIVAGNGAYAGPDIIALDTVNYSGRNVFSQGGVGRGGIDIYAPDTATIFASLVTIDPSPADGDEFQAGLLADNGGPVQTVAIKFGGDAYNNGDNTALPADTEDLDGDTDSGEDLPFDARGLARVAQGTVDIGAFEIQTIPVNSAPVNTVPGTQEIDANTATAVTGLSVADPDAGGASITTTLSVAHGTLSVTSAGGAGVAGSGTSSVTLTGSVGQINATLAAADNVVYTGAHDFFGTDTLTVLTDDGGNTGSGGALTDTDSVTLNINTLTTGTPGDDAYEALRGQEMFIGLGGIDTITFNFRLVDAQVSYEGNKVIIDGPTSHTVLTGFEVFVFTDGTVHNDDGSPLVDDLFYYSKYHDVWDAHVDADTHYNTFGWHEGRDPDAFFSTAVYLSANPDVKAAGVNPLLHFDANGWLEGRVPSITFDPAQYLAANPDVAAAHVDPLRHYLAFGYQEGRVPIAPTELLTENGFDYVYYLNHNPDVKASGVDPFQHFETVGWQEGRNPNALFDVNGYLANYADVAAAHINPLDHYNQFGWHEGRDPSPAFDTTSYLAAYADVNAAHVNPLTHLHFGIHEGRSPFADGVWG